MSYGCNEETILSLLQIPVNPSTRGVYPAEAGLAQEIGTLKITATPPRLRSASWVILAIELWVQRLYKDIHHADPHQRAIRTLKTTAAPPRLRRPFWRCTATERYGYVGEKTTGSAPIAEEVAVDLTMGLPPRGRRSDVKKEVLALNVGVQKSEREGPGLHTGTRTAGW